jgi:hypothetical protein
MPIAKALHVSGTTAKGGGPTASLAFRVAGLADVGVDDLLTGRLPAHGTCPHCCGRSASIARLFRP